MLKGVSFDNFAGSFETQGRGRRKRERYNKRNHFQGGNIEGGIESIKIEFRN